MKFSNLSTADLATHEIAEIENAAIPAIPAIDVDFKGNPLAIPLLFDAIPLLFENSPSDATTTNSSRIAVNSSRIANPELPIPDTNQEDEEKIAGIAKIAASGNCKNAKEAQALTLLQRLYAEHEQRLIAAGHDGKGALVCRKDYWQALRKARINPDTAFDLLDAGRVRIQADGLYWVPLEEVAP